MEEKDEISFGFFVRVDENGVLRVWYQRKRLPVEIAMVQLRALLNHLENPYFNNFSNSVSSMEYDK